MYKLALGSGNNENSVHFLNNDNFYLIHSVIITFFVILFSDNI